MYVLKIFSDQIKCNNWITNLGGSRFKNVVTTIWILIKQLWELLVLTILVRYSFYRAIQLTATSASNWPKKRDNQFECMFNAMSPINHKMSRRVLPIELFTPLFPWKNKHTSIPFNIVDFPNWYSNRSSVWNAIYTDLYSRWRWSVRSVSCFSLPLTLSSYYRVCSINLAYKIFAVFKYSSPKLRWQRMK